MVGATILTHALFLRIDERLQHFKSNVLTNGTELAIHYLVSTLLRTEEFLL